MARNETTFDLIGGVDGSAAGEELRRWVGGYLKGGDDSGRDWMETRWR